MDLIGSASFWVSHTFTQNHYTLFMWIFIGYFISHLNSTLTWELIQMIFLQGCAVLSAAGHRFVQLGEIGTAGVVGQQPSGGDPEHCSRIRAVGSNHFIGHHCGGLAGGRGHFVGGSEIGSALHVCGALGAGQLCGLYDLLSSLSIAHIRSVTEWRGHVCGAGTCQGIFVTQIPHRGGTKGESSAAACQADYDHGSDDCPHLQSGCLQQQRLRCRR